MLLRFGNNGLCNMTAKLIKTKNFSLAHAIATYLPVSIASYSFWRHAQGFIDATSDRIVWTGRCTWRLACPSFSSLSCTTRRLV